MKAGSPGEWSAGSFRCLPFDARRIDTPYVVGPVDPAAKGRLTSGTAGPTDTVNFRCELDAFLTSRNCEGANAEPASSRARLVGRFTSVSGRTSFQINSVARIKPALSIKSICLCRFAFKNTAAHLWPIPGGFFAALNAPQRRHETARRWWWSFPRWGTPPTGSSISPRK